MNYRRLYWATVAGLGVLLLVRHGPALAGPGTMAGNLPPVLGVIVGIGILWVGGRGLYLGDDAGGPDEPGAMLALVLVLFLLQAAAVVAWMAGFGWR